MTNCDKRCHYIALIVSMLVTLFSVLPSQALLAQSEPLGLGEEGQLYQLDDARLPPGTPEQMQMALLATGDYRIDALNSGYR